MVDKKPFLVMVSSQKGGVGKTTVAINLAIALTYQDYSVLLVDTDAATFSIREHLGIKGSGNGYKEAIEGEMAVDDTIFSYEPLGLHLILGSPEQEITDLSPENVNRFYSQLAKLNYDFIIVDSQPGYFSASVAKYLNDVAIVTTPDQPSAMSSAKLSGYCERLKLPHRLIINRSGGNKFELQKEEVERMFGDVAYAILPEDKAVSEGLSKYRPAYMLDRGSPFSAAMESFARVYMLKVGQPDVKEASKKSTKRRGFFGMLAHWTIRDESDRQQN